nr:hypothetical protein SPACI_03140 [Sporomusa acidovorans DSM 3132]
MLVSLPDFSFTVPLALSWLSVLVVANWFSLPLPELALPVNPPKEPVLKPKEAPIAAEDELVLVSESILFWADSMLMSFFASTIISLALMFVALRLTLPSVAVMLTLPPAVMFDALTVSVWVFCSVVSLVEPRLTLRDRPSLELPLSSFPRVFRSLTAL